MKGWILAALGSAALTASACAGPASISPPGAAALSRAPSAAFDIAGTYHGGVRESQGGQHRSGIVAIKLQQSGNAITGTFDVTFQGKTDDLTVAGTVTSEHKASARLSIELDDASGEYAAGTADAGVDTLKGQATAAGTSSEPELHISFTTRKTK